MALNMQEHAPFSDEMRWLCPEAAAIATLRRQELLREIEDRACSAFNATKLFTGEISPGCRLCGEGAWSCLFINNLCNAHCFFCPARQDTLDEPGTGTLTFTSPEEYADYLERFGFSGASISGGEPLISFDRTITFVTRVKKRFGETLYLWLYTNGTLATKDKLCRLADAGLDEIRFNITATGYDLSPARMATGIIPCVTVEIPAVPEDLELMKTKLGEMADSGIAFLNLHQIRCTPHNRGNLEERQYTFLHGPAIGVLESEMAALCLLEHAIGEHIGLHVHYCSLIYRQRFQAKASRRRWAPFLTKPHEDITETGMIRTLFLEGEPERIDRIEAGLIAHGIDPALWSKPLNRNRLLISPALLRLLEPPAKGAGVSYSHASPCQGLSYHNPFREITLASGRKIFIERGPAFPDIPLSPQELELFRGAFLDRPEHPADMDAVYEQAMALHGTADHQEKWQKIIHAEGTRSGLLEYY
ncbi:MAG: radical SAM protein [Syntrophaceae bacterium]